MKQAVEKALALIRPVLQSKGSDVELLSVTEYGMVEVKISGVCTSSSEQRIITFLDLEDAVKELVPEVKFLTENKL